MGLSALHDLDHIISKVYILFLSFNPPNKKDIKHMHSSELETQKKEKDFISFSILTTLAVVIIFIESIIILINGLRKGLLKKEVLSKQSNLGFDIDIIMKS